MTTFYEDALQYRGCYEEGAQCQLHFMLVPSCLAIYFIAQVFILATVITFNL